MVLRVYLNQNHDLTKFLTLEMNEAVGEDDP